MNVSGKIGIFTVMSYLKHLLARFRMGVEPDPAWAEWDKIGDRFRLPREWVHCTHCGAYSWRIPPHALDPCPLVVEMSESAGLKMDAERTTAIKSGVQLEEFMRMMQQQLGQGDDE